MNFFDSLFTYLLFLARRVLDAPGGRALQRCRSEQRRRRPFSRCRRLAALRRGWLLCPRPGGLRASIPRSLAPAVVGPSYLALRPVTPHQRPRVVLGGIPAAAGFPLCLGGARGQARARGLLAPRRTPGLACGPWPPWPGAQPRTTGWWPA
jgi:hypothetical protein